MWEAAGLAGVFRERGATRLDITGKVCKAGDLFQVHHITWKHFEERLDRM